MKRVLFVDQSQVLGGAELSLIDICQGFPNCVVAVFAAGDFSNRLAELEIEHEILSVSKTLTDVKRQGGIVSEVLAIPALASAAFAISRLAKDFDVIYANTQKAMLVAGVGGWLSRKPVCWHLRDLMIPEHFGQKVIKVSVGAANRLVDKVIANSNATRDAFVDAGGHAEKVVTVHNGIKGEPFEKIDSSDVERLRRTLSTEGRKVAGIFSRISNWKGQHLLIEALANRPDWDVLIVGDALFQNDHEYKQRLLNLVSNLDLESRVHFVGFRNDIPELMSLCDVVVHASTSPEPFGRVIVEGMLAKSVVIAAEGGGASEIVRDRENGYLFDTKVPDSLGVVLDSLENGADTTQLLETAYQEASTYYSVDRMIKEVAWHVNSLAAR